jgi:hypothetical protein
MAKKKGKGKKGGGKHKGKVAAPAMIGTFAGGVLGKVVEKLLADTIRDFVLPQPPHRKKHDAKHEKGRDDVAARLLTAVADDGPKPIARLLADTNLGLSPMLNALHTLRDFHLISFVGEPGDGETVEVTRAGADAHKLGSRCRKVPTFWPACRA